MRRVWHQEDIEAFAAELGLTIIQKVNQFFRSHFETELNPETFLTQNF